MSEHTQDSPAELGRKKAEETAEAAQRRASTLKDDAIRTAGNVAEGAKARVASEVNARAEGARDTVAEAIEDTAATLRTAAERMSDGTPQSEAVHRAANTVSGVATQVRETDIASLGDELTTLARRYPVPFLAGAGLLGFAAGRFLRASAKPAGGAYDAPPPADYPVPAPAYAHDPRTPVHADKPRTHAAPAGAAGSKPAPAPTPATGGVSAPHAPAKEV